MAHNIAPIALHAGLECTFTFHFRRATAKEAALRLLNLRRYPAKKLTEKLLEKGHPPDSIEQALHDLERVVR